MTATFRCISASPSLRSFHGTRELGTPFISAVLDDRPPAVNVHEAIAMTTPGIVAMAACRKGGVQMKDPSFDPKPQAWP